MQSRLVSFLFLSTLTVFQQGPAAQEEANGSGQSYPDGHGGELVVHFTDNRLIDVAGSDLYVFEVGPDVEATG
ncbi:MAG: hypothetical protein ACQETO_00470, partial [Pseudomonadota bacterium]